METTFIRPVKGSTMETIFNTSDDNFIVKYYKAIDLKEESYDPNKTYEYEILIRHNENMDAKKIFKSKILSIEYNKGI